MRHQPEGLEQLLARTKFTKQELQALYRGFKNVSPGGCPQPEPGTGGRWRSAVPLCPPQECPSGLVDEDTFKLIYSQFFPQGGELGAPPRAAGGLQPPKGPNPAPAACHQLLPSCPNRCQHLCQLRLRCLRRRRQWNPLLPGELCQGKPAWCCAHPVKGHAGIMAVPGGAILAPHSHQEEPSWHHVHAKMSHPGASTMSMPGSAILAPCPHWQKPSHHPAYAVGTILALWPCQREPFAAGRAMLAPCPCWEVPS